MQPFINPYYYQQPQQQYPQYASGYQPNVPQAKSRIVNDFAEITANDVPMDGSQAMFLKADGSEIQVRAWSSNGQIVTTSYKPILDEVKEKPNKLPLNEEKLKNDLLDELTGLFDDRFAKLEKLVRPNARTKKENVADE